MQGAQTALNSLQICRKQSARAGRQTSGALAVLCGGAGRQAGAASPAPRTALTPALSLCRDATGRNKHRLWDPRLDPPALLADVAVVLVAPKRPSSVGAAARACGCFECEDLRLVAPRCDPLIRSARNGAKGSQYLLWRAQQADDLAAVLQGAALTVAFTRWVAGAPAAYDSVASLLASPMMMARFGPEGGGAGVSDGGSAPLGKVVLVFGREERGLDPAEVAACDVACSIPIGRLQESLSLSHAVSLALAPLFEARLRQRGGAAALAGCAADLAAGVQTDAE